MFFYSKAPGIEPTTQPEVSPYALAAPKNSIMDVKSYAQIRAIEAGVNPNKFTDLIDCESSWKVDAIGDSGNAFGLLQFWKRTFDRFSKMYNLKGDIHNPYDQIDLALLMVKDGYAFHWTCAKIIGLK